MDRQLEYDTGPEFEDESAEPAGGERRRRDPFDAPWKVGLAGSVGAFVAMYAIMYQFASAMIAVGMMGPPETTPGRRVVAGLSMLASHGVTIEEGGEPIEGGFAVVTGFTSHVSALVPAVVLGAAGYLLVRHLAESDVRETVRTAARAGGAFVAGYVVLAIALAWVSRWTPEREDGPGAGEVGVDESETLAVALDSSLVLTVAGTAATFLVIGGLLALYVTFGDRTPEDGPDDEPADGDDEPGPDDGLGGEEPATDDEPATDRSPGSDDGDYPPRRSVDPDRGYGDADRRYGPDDEAGRHGDDESARYGDENGESRDDRGADRYGESRDGR